MKRPVWQEEAAERRTRHAGPKLEAPKEARRRWEHFWKGPARNETVATWPLEPGGVFRSPARPWP